MTANQIAFFNAKEAKRHNLQSEVIEGRKAGASEKTAEASARRASAATTQAYVAQLAQGETARHNRVDEQRRQFEAEHQALLQDRQGSAAATQAAAAKENAAINRANAYTRRDELGETRREHLFHDTIADRDVSIREKTAPFERFERTTRGVKNITGALSDVVSGVRSSYNFVKGLK